MLYGDNDITPLVFKTLYEARVPVITVLAPIFGTWEGTQGSGLLTVAQVENRDFPSLSALADEAKNCLVWLFHARLRPNHTIQVRWRLKPRSVVERIADLRETIGGEICER
jgi:hypothetical protein